MKIKIDKKFIGEDEPCFIIAEAGINHNGDINIAKKLVDQAKYANADAVKFQTYKTEELVIDEVEIPDYAEKNLGRKITQYEMIKMYELKYKDFEEIKKYCDSKEIIFLSTPHSFDAIDFLDNLVPAYKFGSGDITNIPALVYSAKKGKPLILSTGMSTITEIKNAINVIRKEGNNQIIALHCTTNYPCPLNEVNMNAMITMQNELDCLIGYSDHTLGILIPIIARAMGATLIEKHLTLNKKLIGPDHKTSLEPKEFKLMVKKIRDVEKSLGENEKKPTLSEKNIMKYVRKSIVAKDNIKKDSIIDMNMINIKRPGTGLSPLDYDKIIGKKANRNISKDEMLAFDMVD